MIEITGKTWHLQGKSYSYVMVESPEGDLFNFHYGKKIDFADYSADFELYNETDRPNTNCLNLNAYPQEYPGFGHQDFRESAYEIKNGFGNIINLLKVKSSRIIKGEAFKVCGMPSLYGNADTLEIVLFDAASKIEVKLYYVVFDDLDTIGRSAVIVNRGNTDIDIHRAFSFNLDLPEDDFDAIWFQGDWGRERMLERCPIHKSARMDISDTSGRGGRQVNPFVMVAQKRADEEIGTVYGFNLIYSCNHTTIVEGDTTGRVRITQGISPKGFKYTLHPNEEFYTPQAVLGFSANGIGELSRQYHKTYREHLINKNFVNKPRPVLINNWEATRFDFTQDQILAMAKIAKSAGIEMFVLDDGWFGERNSTAAGLGDWTVNPKKLPLGIEGLAQSIIDMGLKFGLWFEPEMINPDSDLYRAHPDWAVRVPQIEPVLSREQYVLDLTRDEICDYVIDAVSKILECGKISYVKWDMNREILDVPFEGFHHRYALGLYKIMDALTSRFPEILFEGCASGGGRFDAGVLSFMPQIWTSDNTDAYSRMKIQYSTSVCYPLSSISAHITAVPNKQTMRVTPLKTRADVAFSGVFGYELDITKTTEEEREEFKKQIAFAKKMQPLILNGDFYRLRSPFETNECVWEIANDNAVYVMAGRAVMLIGKNRYREPFIKLKGLDENASYKDTATGKVYTGRYLMNRGLRPTYPIEDFSTVTYYLEKM